MDGTGRDRYIRKNGRLGNLVVPTMNRQDEAFNVYEVEGTDVTDKHDGRNARKIPSLDVANRTNIVP